MVKIGAKRRNSRQEESESSFDGRKKQRTKTPVNDEETLDSTQAGSRRRIDSKRRKSTSKVWDDFDRYIDPEGKDVAKCRHCKVKMTANNGTSHLKKHIDLLICPVLRNDPSRAKKLTPKVTSFQFDQEHSREDSVTNYSSANHTPVTRIYNTRQSKAVLQGHTRASAPAVKNVNDEETLDSTQAGSRRRIDSKRRKSTSKVWDDFDRYIDPEGKDVAKCRHCKVKMTANNGTSHLKKHIDLLICPVLRNDPSRAKKLTPKVTSFQFDQEHSREDSVTNYSSANHTPVTRIYNTRQSKAVLQGHTPASAPAVKNVNDEETLDSTQAGSRRRIDSKRRKSTSKVWDDFDRYIDPEGKDVAKCRHCKVKMTANNGTSHLKKHIDLLICPVLRNDPSRAKKLTPKVTSFQFDQEHSREDSVTNYSSANHTPVTRIYNTRQSKAVLQGHTPASAPAVKNVSATPISRLWTAIRGKFTEGSSVSQPSSGEERSFPSPEDIADFTSEVCKEQSPDEVTKITCAILKEHSPDEVQDEIPLFVPEPAVNNHLPTENAPEGSNNIGTGGDNCGGSPVTTPLSVSEPAANNRLPSKNPHEGSNNIGTTWYNGGKSPARSVNITEIAAMLDGVLYDQDEVGSGPSLVTVHGYRVREQVASLLGVIIDKYGDIAEKCTLQGKSSRSTQLEVLCGIVQRLKRLCFKEISSSELETMRTEISDLASLGLDVGWLQQRVEMVSKALSLFWGAATLMEKRRDNREEVELHKKEFEKLEKEIEEMEKEIEEMVKKSEAEAEKIEKLKVEGEEIEEMVAEINLTLKGFLGGESLVEGLL